MAIVKRIASEEYADEKALKASSAALTSAKEYTDAEITEWVGDKTVSEQISEAVAQKSQVQIITWEADD